MANETEDRYLQLSMKDSVQAIMNGGVPVLLTKGDSLYFVNPVAKKVEYKGTIQNEVLVPVATFSGIKNLINVPETLRIIIAPEIIAAAQRDCREYTIHINNTAGTVVPDFNGCYEPRDEFEMADRLIMAYHTATEIGMRVDISGVNRSIIENRITS